MNNADQEHYPLDILQHFLFNNSSYEVTILWKNDKPLFRATDIAKVLDIKKIRNTLLTYDTDEKVAHGSGTLGGTQEMLFLTEIGLYRLLFQSHKPMAKPFQKWVAKVLRDIQLNGKYEVENLKAELALEKFKNEQSIRNEKHKWYLDIYHKKRVVYFAKIGEICGKNLIKLGGTKKIRKTFLERHPKDYPNIKLIYIIESDQYIDFEQYLLHHSYIRNFLYKEPVKHDGGSSIETILVSDDELAKVIRIAVANSKKFPKSIISNEKVDSLEQKFTQQQIQLNEIKELLIKSINKDDNVTTNIVDESKLDSETLLKEMSSPEKKIRKREYVVGTGKCIDCNVDITVTAKKCINCNDRAKKFQVPKETLQDLVWNQKLPFTKIGKMYGVSDNAIRKRCRTLEIEVRKTKNPTLM